MQGLGKLHSTPFMHAYQGNYWGNHRSGLDMGKMMHARLADSYRLVRDPTEAHVFFIPLDTQDSCYARKGSEQWANWECGIDFRQYSDISGMWQWLLQQESFLNSNGSDHFIFATQPLPYLEKKVCTPS